MSEFYWLSLSEDDIREKYKRIKEDVLLDTGLENLITIETPDHLLKLINSFKKVTSGNSEERYFKSTKHKLGFMLLNHQGNIFDEELGIKKKHYLNKEAAKEWMRKYQSIFNCDKNINDESMDYNEITKKINKIFSQMVGDA